jgi:hypothetical protein
VETDRLTLLEQGDMERRMIQKDLDLMSYTLLNYGLGQPQELKPVARRRMVQRIRVAWMKDPQIGAAVDLMISFVLGRGINRPKANDPQVQEILDEAFDDPDNQLVLTSFEGACALLTDLVLQDNLFLLVFEDGQDGKVKLGLLDHDTVETVVRDPDNRLRVMYYLARHVEYSWDFRTDQPKILSGQTKKPLPGGIANAPVSQPDPLSPSQNMLPGQTEAIYYPHWRNVQDAIDEADAGSRDDPDLCPPEKLGDGKVFHVATNRGSEMAFGMPRMERVIRWANAFNDFMTARVDMMSAAAAFIMKRKVKGTPQQLQKMATQALSRRSMLGLSMEPGMIADIGPKAASIVTENETVDHEPLALNTNAPQAQVDGEMLHGQISAGTGWPQHYTGIGESSLAEATSLELPVLKLVERYQELMELMFKFLFDRAIERAVDTGRLSPELDSNETKPKSKPARQPQPDNLEPGDVTTTAEAYEDEGDDEQDLQRDLGYEFRLANPLKRMIGDLVTAAQLTAQAFDPNNTNTELSRVLLTVILGEGFEIEDPAGAVERIFPQGYEDPAVAAAEGQPGQSAGGGGGNPFGEFGPPNNGFSPDASTGGYGDDAQDPGYGGGYGGGNPYGAVGASQSPEQAQESRLDDESDETRQRAQERAEQIDKLLDQELSVLLRGNGHGGGS